MIVAAVQMTANADKERNVATAERLVEEAAQRGAKFIALPELFTCLSEPNVIVSQAEPIPGSVSRRMGALAARLRITLLAGSIAEQTSVPGKVQNTSVLFGADGTQLAVYRKIHLFDVHIPGQVNFRESDFMIPGQEVVVTETPVGRLGQATCYDLRFPELFRRLVDQGAQIIAIPSAFTQTTGRDHWEVLLRARAIENQVYVVAPNQYGRHTTAIQTYGRSMIIDPWGTVLATAPDGQGVITAAIDLKREDQVRQQVPALSNRRL